ncbi:helix-turn-helix transcriptional regulator (plasmid) [Ligilactobacillus salivarius]|uniref:Helix-turn-helix transcriptional regulator n=2 Tax=Ligilactobacillus salivarius TaxID=1624 RepID=A0ABD7YXQ3_9LACO|nr:helix-turn-helix transcriptional regulator [Ligilactobacillus salivarius]WHS04935.1 helix-turn-helix transcriptional regulator [Ligilactobacillus salivarius]WHS09023.1 helix-turn-helix transcriptional regulator [Ligilactobacillus salivarius]WHS11243.1 helix-turn-helix transcriptional regulator [Ligilactobacillus salivarius]WHS15138.1 helix-turn-helix transcriptional regulator [Ligilactobacillus salivarius]WHS18762.1 helix-turn-helix transcriptional regulator [Ligilactobacillus salivarius]
MLYDKPKTASRLKELRLEAGFTMEEVAKKMKLKSRGTYSDIEHGKSNLTIQNAYILANVYNINVDYLLKSSVVNNKQIIIKPVKLEKELEKEVTYKGKTLTDTDIIALKAFLQGLISSK